MLSKLSNIYYTILDNLRFQYLHHTWKPIDSDTPAAYSNAGYTDETLASELPKILSRVSGITEIDLSYNQLGCDTLKTINQYIDSTQIKSLNLSDNPFDEKAKVEINRLIRRNHALEKLSLSGITFEVSEIDELINSLENNTHLSKIKIDEERLRIAPEKRETINRLLKRNEWLHIFRENHGKDTLDLSNKVLSKEGVDALAYYIKMNSRWLTREGASIKEIKMPSLERHAYCAGFEPLIEALKQHTKITHFTYSVPQSSLGAYEHLKAQDQAIRQQLLINKAKRKVMGKPYQGFFAFIQGNFISHLITAQIAFAIVPSLPIAIAAFFGSMAFKATVHQFFDWRLNKAKEYDYSDPATQPELKKGQKSAHNFVTYLNPRAWTPMAYLGFQSEKHQLAEKYQVKDECFQYQSKQKPKV